MRGLKASAKAFLKANRVSVIPTDAGNKKLSNARTIDVVKAALKHGW